MTDHTDQLERRLAERMLADTEDVVPTPGFAERVLDRGHRLRRRRTSATAAGSAVALVVGGLVVAALVPALRGTPEEAAPAHAGVLEERLAWARSLPAGEEPRLPQWTGEGLRDGDRVVTVPERVDRSMPPVRVGDDRWIVLTGDDFRAIAPAVLDADGELEQTLQPSRDAYRSELRTPQVHVSSDGGLAAYGDLVVDLGIGGLTEIPHRPRVLLGWTDEGLVYEGEPTERGSATEWLLRPDGATTRLGDPDRDVRSPGRGAAGFAVSWDYAEDGPCLTVHRLRDGERRPETRSCPGQHLGDVLDLSPDGRWLLTDELPRVWDAEGDGWATLDVPAEAFAGEDWHAEVGWEDDDSFLLPVLDRRPDFRGSPEEDTTVTATVQVVRCTMSTLACERAGEERRMALGQEWHVEPAIGFAAY